MITCREDTIDIPNFSPFDRSKSIGRFSVQPCGFDACNYPSLGRNSKCISLLFEFAYHPILRLLANKNNTSGDPTMPRHG